MAGIVKLKVVAGPMMGEAFVFEEHDTFLFGRAPECHISLPDDSYISRHHFMLEINPPVVFLRDLGSLNGTGVNGILYGGPGHKKGSTPEGKDEVRLKDGDQIYAGKTVFSLAIELPPLPEGWVRCRACGQDLQDATCDGTREDYLCEPCRRKGTPGGGHEPATVAVGPMPWGIAGYEIERELGRGAMGSVHLARRKADDTRVAVKVLFARVAMSEQARQLFMREMEVLRGLRHPNIVTFIDGTSSCNAFHLVMEYCNLGSVDDLLGEHGVLPFDMATSILQQALTGLAYAHSKSFVHRDLKPGNILLRGNRDAWQAKLSDFGLAKSFDKAGCSGMTATGSYGGTLHYMPREQITNYKYVRPVSDVWSLAATYYRMLTGESPREIQPGQDPVSVVLRAETVPIRVRMPALPPSVAGVVDCALSADPGPRYASAIEFLSALEQAL